MAKKQRKNKYEASKFELFRASQSQNISRYYQFFFRAVIGIALLFFVLGIAIRPKETFDDYALGTQLSTNQIGVSVTEKYLNSAQNKVYLRVVIQPSTEAQQLKKSTLTFKVKLKGASSSDVKFEMFKGNNYYYDVVLDDIPDTWVSMKLYVSADDFRSESVFTFGRHAEKEAYKILKDDAIFSTEVAQVRAIQQEISHVQFNIATTVPEKIKANEEDILALEKEIEAIESDKKFQTEAEIKKTNLEKSHYETNVISLRQGIENLKQHLQELQEKESLLQQKMTEVASKNGVDLSKILVE